MEHIILDGKALSAHIKQELKNEIEARIAFGETPPGLAVIVVGDDPASQTYVKNKIAGCREVGIRSQVYYYNSITKNELKQRIDELNRDNQVNGILVQLPLLKGLDEKKVANWIVPFKDVDCFHSENVGLLNIGTPRFKPCTPAGIIELLKYNNIMIEGKHCVIVGRSNIVGKPLAQLLLAENATVTVCHSHTRNLAGITQQADILISAVGKPKFITQNMVYPGTAVIDVGINRDENGKLCGDVDYEKVSSIAGAITPVPGGVGPMTIAMLLRNTVESWKNRDNARATEGFFMTSPVNGPIPM